MTTIPGGKSSVTPYVVAKGADKLLTFLEDAFEADVYLKVPNPDGTIGHAEAKLGGSVLMVFDSAADWPFTPSFLSVYVDDVDAVVKKAEQAGAFGDADEMAVMIKAQSSFHEAMTKL